MSGSAHSQLALNFFFLLFTDEALAITGAARTIKSFKKKQSKTDLAPDVLLVSEILKTYRKLKRKIHKKNVAGTHSLTQSQWVIPKPSIFAEWKEFLKKSILSRWYSL